MTTRRTASPRTTRRRVTPPAKTAEDVANMAPRTRMPASHKLGGELEGYAQAAGRYWRALREAGLPIGFRVAMFDNWQSALWSGDDPMSVTAFRGDAEYTDNEGEAV